MTTDNMANDENDESTDNSELFAYYNDISDLFKKIKSKGILNKSIIIDTYEVADDKLLDSGEKMNNLENMKNKYITPELEREFIEKHKQNGLTEERFYELLNADACKGIGNIYLDELDKMENEEEFE